MPRWFDTALFPVFGDICLLLAREVSRRRGCYEVARVPQFPPSVSMPAMDAQAAIKVFHKLTAAARWCLMISTRNPKFSEMNSLELGK